MLDSGIIERNSNNDSFNILFNAVSFAWACMFRMIYFSLLSTSSLVHERDLIDSLENKVASYIENDENDMNRAIKCWNFKIQIHTIYNQIN